jgi:shikimate dehydrogenase
MADTDRAHYGLVGGRLSHSYSKIIHELFGTYTYDLFSMPRRRLTAFLRRPISRA